MQMDAAAVLRATWAGKPCPHPEIEREYHLGAHTGDFVCKICGASFSPEQRDEIDARRRSSRRVPPKLDTNRPL
jgi:hypothetical protein